MAGVVLGWVRVLLVCVLVVVVQWVLVGDLRIAGSTADLPLVVAMAAGITAGPRTGTLVAFCVGTLFDLTLTTPLGASALAFALVAYALGTLQGSVWRPAWWLVPLECLIAGAAAAALAAGLLVLVGTEGVTVGGTLTDMAVVGVCAAVAGPAIVRVVRWAVRPILDA
jgi:rod shape-determining protein MreD